MDNQPTPSRSPQARSNASRRGGHVEPARRDTDLTAAPPSHDDSKATARAAQKSEQTVEQKRLSEQGSLAKATGPMKARPALEKSDSPSGKDKETQTERAAQVARLESALVERYLIKRAPLAIGDLSVGTTEYRFRGDTARVAFTESSHRLATDANNPTVARSMVDVAEARNWKTLRVTGNDEFRRMVWLEASVRGVKTLGYEPNTADLERLRFEREQRQNNRIEHLQSGATPRGTHPTDKTSARGNGGHKAVLVAIEAVLVAKKVPQKQREAILISAADKLSQRIREGQTPKVRVCDKTAPSQRPVPPPVQEQQRGRERSAPVR
jgi:hypothetical protein